MKAAGTLYEPESSAFTEAILERDGSRYRIRRAGDATGREVEIRPDGPRLTGVPQAVLLATGHRFLPHEELPAGFFGRTESAPGRWVDWLERFSPRRIALLVLLVALGLFGLRALIPPAADLASRLVPRHLEAAAGAQTFRELDALLLEPSLIPEARQMRIRQAARQLARRGGLDPVPEIHFRDAPKIGANAFALPGGPVLVTDALVRALSDDEIVAVLAHEFGHVEERHALRRVLRVAGLFLVASLVLGGDGGVLEEIGIVAAGLATSSYTRGFEQAADDFAARLLAAGGRPPLDLGRALQTLQKTCGTPCEGESGWFSTHPSVSERLQKLRNPPESQ